MPETDAVYVRVGQIVGAFGLRGHVKVLPLTDFLARFDKGLKLRINDDLHEIQENKWHKNQLLLKLEGIDNIGTAEGFQWAYLEARSDERPALEEDQFLTEDLVGLEVKGEGGRSLGKVDEVLSLPAHDVLVVGRVMIPTVKEFVKEVNLDDGIIIVELIPGMEEVEDEPKEPAPKRNTRRRSLS